MDAPFDTNFRFSRFDAVRAKPRDVAALKGRKSAARKGKGFSFAGASPDVDDDEAEELPVAVAVAGVAAERGAAEGVAAVVASPL
eukprot:1298577-Prymnesium_polylepis.1